jgi:hypothetical protein
MTDIEEKALALVREVLAERDLSDKRAVRREVSPYTEALCRAIEQHEAFKQEVSDVVYRSLMSIAKNCVADAAGDLSSFIIPKPKPDPLVEVVEECSKMCPPNFESAAKVIRAKLDALGFEIKEKAHE